jgi:hypothetical protein
MKISTEMSALLALSPHHRPPPQACRGSHNSVRVPYVRTSVRGPNMMGKALRTGLDYRFFESVFAEKESRTETC